MSTTTQSDPSYACLPPGRSFQDELVTVKGTRKQLMERLKKLFAEWSPHDWIDRWATHQRHLT